MELQETKTISTFPCFLEKIYMLKLDTDQICLLPCPAEAMWISQMLCLSQTWVCQSTWQLKLTCITLVENREQINRAVLVVSWKYTCALLDFNSVLCFFFFLWILFRVHLSQTDGICREPNLKCSLSFQFHPFPGSTLLYFLYENNQQFLSVTKCGLVSRETRILSSE